MITERVSIRLPPQGAGYSQTTGENGYLIGPSIEWRLNSRLSLQADALYRPLRFTQAAVLPDGALNSVSPATVVTWQFPVLAKYRLRRKSWAPFLEGGPSFRTAGNLNGTNPSHYGATVGAGVEMRAGSWAISPQVRYTRWAKDDPGQLVQSIPNRVEFLVGIHRLAASRWRPLGSRFALGAIVGATLTDDFRTTASSGINIVDGTTVTSVQSSGPRSFIVGPSVELNVGKGLSVEVNAIYRPIRSMSRALSPVYPDVGEGKRVTWEFPVLARYSFAGSNLAPFVELGPSFRTPQEIYGASLSTYGVTAGIGVEARRGGLKMSPALRYTHWGADSPKGQSQTLRNQLALVVGFSL